MISLECIRSYSADVDTNCFFSVSLIFEKSLKFLLFSKQNPSQSVAVKVVTKKGIQKASEILVKEIKILRELTALHHTNLVAMHDCMDSPAYVYVVMEVGSQTYKIFYDH